LRLKNKVLIVDRSIHTVVSKDGLNLALQAKGFGLYALVIFAIVHWLCDLIWLTILSLTAFHGTAILSAKNQKLILGFCGTAMIGFGLKFLIGAILQ